MREKSAERFKYKAYDSYILEIIRIDSFIDLMISAALLLLKITSFNLLSPDFVGDAAEKVK